jgi:hypothetical protein
MRASLLFSLGAAMSLQVACIEDERAYSSGGPTAPMALQASAPDVSGAWSWSATQHLTVPPFVAELIFGIAPEGPVTQLRCESTGTMQLAQNGVAFNGSATQTVNCVTGGGHAFVAPPMAAPPSFAVAEGRITGNAIHFLFGSGDLACPYSGVITGSDGGTATDLTATGRCIVPGHPKSPAPLDPPPAGTSKTISWTATRP